MKQTALIPDGIAEDQCVTDKRIRIVLPYPPTLNNARGYRVQLPSTSDIAEQMHRGSPNSLRKWLQSKAFVQTYMTEETKQFKVAVWTCVSKLGARVGWDMPLSMAMDIHPPDRRKRDASNLWKWVEDALMAAGVFKDDSQIKKHTDAMLEIRPGGMVVVELTKLI